MNSWKTKVNSLCLIPETKCTRNCTNCYEKMKNYGEKLTEKSYITLVLQTMESLPSLTEVLIDYNGNASIKLLKECLSLNTKLKAVITTNIEGAIIANGLTADLHVSIHSPKDIDILKNSSIKPSSVSIMVDDIGKLPLHQLGDVPFYFIFNKFGYPWRARNYPDLYLSTIQQAQIFNQYTIDHCMLTRFNGQQCPASTQINVYRDGSIRRCPYQPQEPDDADYSKGCALIGADK